jgi:hypothetical protein
MQAIQVKFLPPTNFKGSRYKAWCERGSIIIGSDFEFDGEANAKAAARALIARFLDEDKRRFGSVVQNPWAGLGRLVASPVGAGAASDSLATKGVHCEA